MSALEFIDREGNVTTIDTTAGGYVEIVIDSTARTQDRLVRGYAYAQVHADDLVSVAHLLLAKAQESCGSEEIEQAMALLVVGAVAPFDITPTVDLVDEAWPL